MQYTVVEDHDPEQLSERVQTLLNDGWELHGDLLLVAYDFPGGTDPADQHRTIYAQALTNESDPLVEVADDERPGRTLAELLGISENQLPPDTEETRAEMLDKLGEVFRARRDVKKPEIDSE